MQQGTWGQGGDGFFLVWSVQDAVWSRMDAVNPGINFLNMLCTGGDAFFPPFLFISSFSLLFSHFHWEIGRNLNEKWVLQKSFRNLLCSEVCGPLAANSLNYLLTSNPPLQKQALSLIKTLKNSNRVGLNGNHCAVMEQQLSFAWNIESPGRGESSGDCSVFGILILRFPVTFLYKQYQEISGFQSLAFFLRSLSILPSTPDLFSVVPLEIVSLPSSVYICLNSGSSSFLLLKSCCFSSALLVAWWLWQSSGKGRWETPQDWRKCMSNAWNSIATTSFCSHGFAWKWYLLWFLLSVLPLLCS